jgi:hypothetical protein
MREATVVPSSSGDAAHVVARALDRSPAACTTCTGTLSAEYAVNTELSVVSPEPQVKAEIRGLRRPT